MTKIISAFPGTGKTVVSDLSESIIDSDSSRFSKEHGEFPSNYLAHINRIIAGGKASHILVSTHPELLETFHRLGMEFTLVYPSPDLKEEYLERYRNRGSDPEFIKSMEIRFDEMVERCADQEGCEHIMLEAGEHLWNQIDDFADVEVPKEIRAEASSGRYSLTIDGHSHLNAQTVPGDGTDDGDEDGKKHEEKKKSEIEEAIKEKEEESSEKGSTESDGDSDSDSDDDDEGALDALDKIKIPGEDDDDEDDDEDEDEDDEEEDDEDDEDDDLDGDYDDGDNEATASSGQKMRIPRDVMNEALAFTDSGIVIVYYPGLIQDSLVDGMRGRYSVAVASADTLDKVEGTVKFVQYRPGLFDELKKMDRKYVNVYPKHSRKVSYFGEMIKAKWEHTVISDLYDRWEEDIIAMSLDNVPSIQLDLDVVTEEVFPVLYERAVEII